MGAAEIAAGNRAYLKAEHGIASTYTPAGGSAAATRHIKVLGSDRIADTGVAGVCDVFELLLDPDDAPVITRLVTGKIGDNAYDGAGDTITISGKVWNVIDIVVDGTGTGGFHQLLVASRKAPGR